MNAQACLDFETAPPALQLRMSGPPSSTIVAEVVADGGRPGQVWRITSPQRTGSGPGGVYVELPLTTARRYQLELEVNATNQTPPVSYLILSMTGGAYAQLEADRNGMAVYSDATPARLSSTGLSPGWHHLRWLVDFADGGTRVEVDATPLITEATGPIGTTNATGSAILRVGYPFRGDFESSVQTLFDDVLVTP